MHTFQFTVSGDGPFPVDMLRYDNCFPAEASDSISIGICRHDREQYRELRSVRLNYHSARKTASREDITPARWQSFGWTVISPPRRIA